MYYKNKKITNIIQIVYLFLLHRQYVKNINKNKKKIIKELEFIITTFYMDKKIIFKTLKRFSYYEIIKFKDNKIIKIDIKSIIFLYCDKESLSKRKFLYNGKYKILEKQNKRKQKFERINS